MITTEPGVQLAAAEGAADVELVLDELGAAETEDELETALGGV